MALGLFGYRAAASGLYPLVFIDYSPITNNEIERNLSLAYGYYHNALLYSGGDPGKLDVPESYSELKRAVIDEAISRKIILRELKSRVSSEEINEISDRNIGKVLTENPEIEKGVEKLYGVSLADFKEQILLPQAHREILEGRMNLDNQDFSAWLKKTRMESSIIILTSSFSWNGEKVTLK